MARKNTHGKRISKGCLWIQNREKNEEMLNYGSCVEGNTSHTKAAVPLLQARVYLEALKIPKISFQ